MTMPIPSAPPPLDPLLSLAFAMRRTPGAYALLLGSGISRAAGIPTGWEIVLDLIGRVAALEGAPSPVDPEHWYAARFGGAPNYSVLLDGLAKSPAERRQLLRAYFEPDPDERESGAKAPTRAHHAIAELVQRGHIRVIVTTNFDRLVEQALERVGIVPTVISTSEGIAGAMPLMHERVTLIKLHGDYMDTRLLNTEAEVAGYEAPVDALLDRVLDEFGLVVCGWSAAWDLALRQALERCPTRRFTTWWATKGTPGEAAARLIQQRRAEVIAIDSADAFFATLTEKVIAVDELNAPHPASAAVTVATAKRYLVDPVHRIRLQDLVLAEVARTIAAVTSGDAASPDPNVRTYQEAGDTIRRTIAAMDAGTSTLAALLATGTYWAGVEHAGLWVNAIERVAHSTPDQSTISWWTQLRHYPALVLLYAAGLGALAGGQEVAAVRLLTRLRVRLNGDVKPGVLVLHPERVVERGAGRELPDLGQRMFPGSDHLHRSLQPLFADLVAESARYDELFDRFEYLLGLTYVAHRTDGTPAGRFAWRSDRSGFTLFADVEREAKAAGVEWPLLKAGLFEGSLVTFLAAKQQYDARVHRRGMGG